MSATNSECSRQRRTIDAHFAARGEPAAVSSMFAHVPDCAECRRYYERHLLLAELDPRAPSAETRQAASLGLRAAPRRRWQWMAAGTLAAATACLLLLLPARQDEFAARGGAATNSLIVYRVRGQSAPERLKAGARISRHDELSFAYTNPEKLEHLMVFATDEHGHVYWYYPAWKDAAADPTAITIQPTARAVDLGEAVAHDLDGRALTLQALFTHATPTVRAIEQQRAQGGGQRLDGHLLQQRLELE